VFGILARRFSSVARGFPLSVGSSAGRPFFELFFAPPPRRGWHEEFQFSEDSDELSEFEDFDYV
jgi:hypothetical protein